MSNAVEEADEPCSICMENHNHTTVTTSCFHKFHYDCIDEWIKTHPCPLCQRNCILMLPLPILDEDTQTMNRIEQELVQIIDLSFMAKRRRYSVNRWRQ